jgi:hypothetical protein
MAGLVSYLNARFNGTQVQFAPQVIEETIDEIFDPLSQGIEVEDFFFSAAYLDNYTCNFALDVTVLPDDLFHGQAGEARFNDNVSVVQVGSVSRTQQTIAHEFGHNFGLLHTFEGSPEIDESPSSTDENNTRDASDPCCNCLTQGDLVCDTPPHSEVTFNNECNGNLATLKGLLADNDFCGQPYNHNNPLHATNLMAYGAPTCTTQLTDGQKARVNTGLQFILADNVIALNVPAITVLENLIVEPGTTYTIDQDVLLDGRVEVGGKLRITGCSVGVTTNSYIALVEGGDLDIIDATVEHYNGVVPCGGVSQGSYWDGIQLESVGNGVSRINITKSTVSDAKILFSTHEIGPSISLNALGEPLGDRYSRIIVDDGSSLNNHRRLAFLNNGRHNYLQLRDTEVTFNGLESPTGTSDGYIFSNGSKIDLQGVTVLNAEPRLFFNFVKSNNMGRLYVDAKDDKRSSFSGIETVFSVSGAIGVEIFNSDFTACEQMLSNSNEAPDPMKDEVTMGFLDVRNNFFTTESNQTVISVSHVAEFDIQGNTIERTIDDEQTVKVVSVTNAVTESQVHDNQISNNEIVNFNYGVNAEGQVGDDTRGLQMYCNDYDNCDQYNIDIQGRMKLLHGSSSDPAGNKFSPVATADGQFRFDTEGPNLEYWYYVFEDDELPVDRSNLVVAMSTDQKSECGTVGHDQTVTYEPPNVPSTQVPTTISTPQVPDGGPFYDPGNGLIGGPNDPSAPDATNPPGNDDCATGPNAPNDPTNPSDPTNPLYSDYDLVIDADYVDGYNVVRNNYWTFMDGGTTLTYVDSIYNYSSSEGRTAILSKAHTLDNQLSPRAAIAFIERIEYYCLTEILAIIIESPVALQNPAVEAFVLANCPTCVLPSDISDDCLYKEGRKHAWLSTKREEYLRAKLHGLLRSEIVNVVAVTDIAQHYSGITAISYILNAYKANEDYVGAVTFLDNDAEDLIRYHYSAPIVEYIDVERHVMGIRASGRTLQEMTEPELETLISYGYLPEYAGAVARSYVSSVLDYEFGDAAFAPRDYTVTGGPCPYSSELVTKSENLEVLSGIYLPAIYQDLAEATDLQVEVFDLMGALVSLDIALVPSGVYIIRCSSQSLQQAYSMKQFILND